MPALPRIPVIKQAAKSPSFRAFVAKAVSKAAARARRTKPDGEHRTSNGANPSSTSLAPQAKHEDHVKWIQRNYGGRPVHVPILPLPTGASAETSTRKPQISLLKRRRPDVDPPAYVQKEDKFDPAAREAHVSKSTPAHKGRPKPAASERAAQTSSGD